MLVHGGRQADSEEVNNRHTAAPIATASQSEPVVHQSSGNRQLSTNRQPTKPAIPDKFNGIDRQVAVDY
jgi:hypothetical protein